jgi:hypothetical protein
MKIKLIPCCILLAMVSRLIGQQYSVEWHKIAGGGGASSGGNYSVSGTIGQHDAGGPMTGGNYSLTGGFWALISVVQTPGAPTLKISFNSQLSTATVSWASPSAGFLLQQNANLATTSWLNFSGATNDDGTNKSVTIHPPTGSLFFRLKQ